MIVFLIFYWLFAFLFLCGWLYRLDVGWANYIYAFVVAGLFFPFVLGYHFCSSSMKEESEDENRN